MRHCAPSAFLLAALVLSACGREAADAGRTTLTDSAGVRIAETGPDDAPLPWTLTEVARIGGADTGAASFSRVGYSLVGTDAADRIYVLDVQAYRVAVFDSLGRPLRTMGRQGGGPGEFQFPGFLWVEPDGRAFVHDLAKQGLVAFDTAGRLLAGARTRLERANVQFALAGDTAYFVRNDFSDSMSIGTLLRAAPADTTELAQQERPTDGPVMFSCVGMNIPRLFTPVLQWDVRGGTLAIAPQVPYVIDVFPPSGPPRRVRRAIAPRPASLQDVERQYPEGMKVQFEGGRSCVVTPKELQEKLGTAPEVPLVSDVRLAPDGSLWVQRFAFPSDPPRTDVFDAEGRYLGTLIGHGRPLGFLGADRVLFRQEDPDTGAEQVVIYRVTRG